MKNNYKKLIASLALAGTVAAGGTFALLSTETGTATNNFASSQKIDGVLYEDAFTGNNITDKTTVTDKDTGGTHITGGNWNNYLPTQEQAKDPTIKIYSTSVTSKVAMRLQFFIGDTKVSYTDFTARIGTLTTTKTDADHNGLNDKWAAATTATTNDLLFTYADAVAPGGVTEAIFDKITINKVVKDANGNEVQTLPSFKIVAKGYAVQDTGTEVTDLVAFAEK